MNKILFAGTPDISVPLLKELAKTFDVVGVLTNCDKSQGRSKELVLSPVKVAATELGLPVIQFDHLNTEAREAVTKLGADTLVTFAFGKIFGPKFLALFTKGTFNVHPSNLPNFRGPSPVQATILASLDKATISVQEVGLKMDEGRIFGQYSFDLSGTENDKTLSEMVSQEAAKFVPPLLKDVFDGKIQSKEQLGEASYCKLLTHDDAFVDFNRPAKEVHSLIRAMYPWPKAFAKVDGSDIYLISVWGSFQDLEAEEKTTEKPGTVVGFRKDRGVGVACSDKVVWISGFQLPTKKELDFKSFANGNPWIKTAKFND